MKRINLTPCMFISVLAVMMIVGFMSFNACDNDNGITEEIATTDNVLSEQEIEDLQFLREEEKLARDVYLYAFNKYGLNVFNNIAASEQKHMDQVKSIMESYGIEDPSLATSGSFSNSTLQDLYVELTAKVDISLGDALEVGATIEDLDIHDLNMMAENSVREDISLLYSNLACGSANHMRSFITQLASQQLSYTAKYISQEQLEIILSSNNGGCSN